MNMKRILAGMAALVLADPVWAYSWDVDFGMVGIVRGQTARLNVVNTSEWPHRSCELALLFFDHTGKRIVVWDQFELAAGQARHLDLNADSLELASGERAQVRARVSFEGRGRGKDIVCQQVVATEEVYDNDTKKTQILNPPMVKGIQFSDPAMRW